MDIENLRSTWQQAGGAVKSEADLQKIARLPHPPLVKKIRKKLLIESVALLSFLLVYYNGLDGDKKPLYANVALVSGLLLYLLTDVMGYIALAGRVQSGNVKAALRQFFIRVKRLALFSFLSSLGYAAGLLIFFTSVIAFNREKRLLLMVMLLLLFQLFYFSLRLWWRWIKQLKLQVQDFKEDE